MPVPVIILAAGASRRLGQPKQLALIAGETLLARTIRVVSESASDPILVVVGAHRESILSTLDLNIVQPVMNRDWEQGIASSIRAGVQTLLQHCPGAAAVLLVVCDQPRLTREHLRTLVEAYEQSGQAAIAASHYAGNPGIPAIFPSSQFANLLALRGDVGARCLLRDQSCPMIAVDFDGGEIDIDTPSNLAALMEA